LAAANWVNGFNVSNPRLWTRKHDSQTGAINLTVMDIKNPATANTMVSGIEITYSTVTANIETVESIAILDYVYMSSASAASGDANINSVLKDVTDANKATYLSQTLTAITTVSFANKITTSADFLLFEFDFILNTSTELVIKWD
jgi:hypothetical protein